MAVTAPFTATVWQVSSPPGTSLADGDPIVSLEAMKMETRVLAPERCTLIEVYVRPGEQVSAGQVLAAVRV